MPVTKGCPGFRHFAAVGWGWGGGVGVSNNPKSLLKKLSFQT